MYINPDKTLKVKECNCSHDKFTILIQPNNRVKIQYTIMSNYYLKDNNGVLKVEYGDTNSYFELIEQKNKSYSIKSISSNLAITRNTDNTLSLSTYDSSNQNQQFLFEDTKKSLFISSNAKYTEDGRFIKSVSDQLGNKTEYEINPTTGVITSQIDSNHIKTNYLYDDKLRVTNISKVNQNVSYSYDTNNNLSKITHGTKNYLFSYDALGNIETISKNNILMNKYYYDIHSQLIKEENLIDNTSIEYIYDTWF